MDDKISQMLNCSLTDNLTITDFPDKTYSDYSHSVWGFWEGYYYPQVIRKSYPVYIQERTLDRGKKAFEIIKILKDKRFINLEKVGDFIDLMDELIKIV